MKPGYISITEQAHQEIARGLSVGSIAVDATTGNGHDTLFLARQVGLSGCVYAIDIQEQALASARHRLAEAGLDSVVTWMQCDHQDMAQNLPLHARGSVDAVLFNLGYLPGGNKRLTTRAESTVAALDASVEMLKPGGMLSVVAYPGHAEGARETEAVEQWLEGKTIRPEMVVRRVMVGPESPRLYVVRTVDGSTATSDPG